MQRHSGAGERRSQALPSPAADPPWIVWLVVIEGTRLGLRAADPVAVASDLGQGQIRVGRCFQCWAAVGMAPGEAACGAKVERHATVVDEPARLLGWGLAAMGQPEGHGSVVDDDLGAGFDGR